jgi:hypothetical protein
MNDALLNQELEERFLRFRRYRDHGSWSGAVTGWAEIFHCLPLLKVPDQQTWTQRLLAEAPAETMINEARTTIHERVARIRRILSVGSEWQGEEILLLLGLRIDIDFLLDFLRDGLGHEFSVSLNDIDEDLLHLSTTTLHRGRFRESARLMKRNWGLPIRSKWIDSYLS